MRTVYHAAQSRGHADHGWLDAHHTFSFAGYYDPERMGFGALRVLNDDAIAAGRGFGMHPHDNMEIITIPLEGSLHHRDSMGNSGIIRQGEIQVMSAGTGIRHSEMNPEEGCVTRLLQIWVFPEREGVTPRYGQLRIADEARPNHFQQIVSPDPEDAGLWVHQQTWFSLGRFDEDRLVPYTMHRPESGLYIFVISGFVTVGEHQLSTRDGLGVYDTASLELNISAGSEVLLMEVPMHP